MATNAVAANILMAVIILGGLVMLLQIKEEVFPEFDMEWVNIHVAYPGASPAEVEQGIVLAIEEAVRGVDGVKQVVSGASESSGGVYVELEISADPVEPFGHQERCRSYSVFPRGRRAPDCFADDQPTRGDSGRHSRARQ